MTDKEAPRGELGTKPHPAAYDAIAYLNSLGLKRRMVLLESFASCAIEGNKDAEVLADTLDRATSGRPVSDRYILGLAWYVRHIMEADDESL